MSGASSEGNMETRSVSNYNRQQSKGERGIQTTGTQGRSGNMAKRVRVRVRGENATDLKEGAVRGESE